MSWSKQLGQRYQCTFSDDIADWFDREIWNQKSQNEYRCALDPQSLLVERPEAIWPGLMPCDFLPLLGSEGGDWLCVRVDDSGTASQIVQWYHGGGDWIPWGKGLADAIAFDAVRGRLPGPKREHATPAEPTDCGHAVLQDDPFVRWAREHLPADSQTLFDPKLKASDLVDGLLEHRIAEVAVRCSEVQRALTHPLCSSLSPDVAKRLNLDWDSVTEWLFDLQRMPDQVRDQVESEFVIQNEQDWRLVTSHCERVTRIQPELSWAWDLLGYVSEKSADKTLAGDYYQQGLACSVFTDQSVRLRTHWAITDVSKFSASGLMRLGLRGSDHEYWTCLCDADAHQRRIQVTEHWLSCARTAIEDTDFARARDMLMLAGWDLGAEPISRFDQILEQLVEAASDAGCNAAAELARTHRACLRERYRL